VLYEDDHLLAIDKPAGVVVHPTHRHAAGTLMNALLWHARQWPESHRPSIVGRLDRFTSGIVLAAKTAAAHAALQRELGSPRCRKEYLAIVYGRVPARGSIDWRLARDIRDRRRVAASRTRGAASLTEFRRVGPAASTRGGLSLVCCRLITGRTHQIRVHLAAEGWPIVGDRVYGEPRWTAIADPALSAAAQAFPRQALHAWRLAFTHPMTRRAATIEAAVPAEMQSILETAGLAYSRE
jgi:23S rRNA pseudouridine1911/1915/1917 synthase